MVEATEKFKRVIGAIANLVSGAIETRTLHLLIGIDRIGNDSIRTNHKSIGGELGTFEIAASQAGATNPEFTGHSVGHRLEIFIQHMELGVGHGQAKRDLVGDCNALGGRPNRGFGGPVHIPQFATARKQLTGEVGSKSLASAKNAEVALPFPTAFQQHAPGGRRRLHHGDGVVPQQSLQFTAVGGLLSGGYDDLRATD